MLRICTRISRVLAIAGTVGVLFAGQGWAAEIWVTNMKSANVQVIDPETMQVVPTIPADKGAHNVTLSKDGKLACVANVGANNVTIIDAESKAVVGTVTAKRSWFCSISLRR